MNELGVENFYIKELEGNIKDENLDNKEKYYIEKYNSFNNGYNATIGGKGGEIIAEKYISDIIERYNKGYSCNEIGKTYKASCTTIWRVLIANNIEPRHDGNKYEQFSILQFVSMWKNKEVTRKDMAEYFKVDSRTIKRFANRLGLGRKGID